MATIKNYLSLIKFSHTIFAMPFALIGFTVAVLHVVNQYSAGIQLSLPYPGEDIAFYNFPGLGLKLLLVLICMVTARSAAMAFNRYLDRQFDAKNPRTAIREIPAGIISANGAILFVVLNCVLFIAATYFLNTLCFLLSPVALFVILFYSYTKRFTALCHLVLGLGLSLAPIGAYLAVTGHFALLPILFSFTVLFWVSGFDVIFALQDEEFDRSQNLFSIPAAFGTARALMISRLLHVVSFVCVLAAGWAGGFGWLYWLGAAFFGSMLVFQHRLVKPGDLSKVNLAFMTANGIASVVFAVFVIADILLL